MARVGYLDTHEGADIDHVYTHLNFYTDRLFQGIINRPLNLHSRDFLIHQADKVQVFLEALLPLVKHQYVKERTESIASKFA